MAREDLREMDAALEEILVCGNLDHDQQELVERSLDQGYLMLDSSEKAMIRRLLNARSSGSNRPGQGMTVLQRWRARRDQTRDQIIASQSDSQTGNATAKSGRKRAGS